jgi:tripartite-type tricarboxylate transporter receptor subunit TctC
LISPCIFHGEAKHAAFFNRALSDRLVCGRARANGRTDLAEQADPRDRSIRGGERNRHRPAHRVRSAVGTAAVARADPDGYTLLATSNAHTIAPAFYANLTYDAAGDFAPVIPFGSVANVLVISPSKGLRTIQDLVAAAKAKPGSFNYASVGVGSATHLSVERLRISAGFEAVHVPFRGGPEALTEVLAGRVEFYFCPINTALPFIREGKLLALVVNATKRSAALPDVPTTIEAGFRDADFPIWIGMLAPANTPGDIVARLHSESVKALQTPVASERLAKAGVEPLIMSPAEFEARIRKEIETNGPLAKVAGVKPN